MQRIRILLVDDSLEFLEAAANLMADWPGIELVGCANSGREALDRLSELHPDVVLVDLKMQDMDGLETTKVLKGGKDAPIVVLVSLDDHPALRDAAFARGADGFIAKSKFYSEALPLIRTLFQGSTESYPTQRASAS